MAVNMYSIASLIGRNVKINRGGPDSVEGILRSVNSDHLVVQTQDGSTVYVNNAHIKSVTDTGTSAGAQENAANPITSDDFMGVMQALRYRYVKVNRAGHEKLEGIIVDVNQNYLLMTVKGKEVVHIPVMHIKSITVAQSEGNKNRSRGNNQGNQSGGNNQSGGSNQSGGNHSKGNRSEGNRSEGNRTGGNRTGGNRTSGNRTGRNRIGGNRTGRNRTGGNRTGRNRTGRNRTGGNRTGRNHTGRNRSSHGE